MEDKKTNYGKIIAITIAVISAATTIAYVIYRLCRNFFTFCDSYREDEIEDADFDFDEIDEDELDDNFVIDDTDDETPAVEAADKTDDATDGNAEG